MLKKALSLAGISSVFGASSAYACESYDDVVSAWLPIMQTTAYYVAIEEGMFEEACINLISNKMQSPNHIIDALVGGRADFGPPGAAAGIAMIAEARFPNTFKVFGLQGGGIQVDRTNDSLVVKEGSDITSFADLEGKTIGHVPGIQWRTITSHLVRAAGLDPETDVQLVDLAVPQQIAAVLGGSVDATLSLEPIGSIATVTDGVTVAVVNPVAHAISDPFFSGAAVLTTAFIEDRPDVARKVVDIIDRATQLANDDFESYKAIIPTYTAIGEEQLEFLAQPYLRGFSDITEVDLDSYQSFVDVFVSEGVLDEPMDVRSKMLTEADFATN